MKTISAIMVALAICFQTGIFQLDAATIESRGPKVTTLCDNSGCLWDIDTEDGWEEGDTVVYVKYSHFTDDPTDDELLFITNIGYIG